MKSEQSYSNGLSLERLIIKSLGADNSEYTIVCTILPIGHSDSSDVHEQLQNGIDLSIKNNGLELIKSIDTLINDYPAIYAVTRKSNQTMAMLSIIKSNQSIILGGVIKYELLQRQHFEHYYNSFKIEK